MPLYYVGDLDKDLANISHLPYVEGIKYACSFYAYGAIQQAVKQDDPMYPGLADLFVQLKQLVAEIGFPEFTRIVQILWADELRKSNVPTMGALDMNYDGTADAQLAAIRAEREKSDGC